MMIRVGRCVLLGIVSSLLTAVAMAAEPSLAEQLPRIPGKSTDEALKTFALQRGFTLDLVAAEPDVVDPIDAAFDADGRMYVVEMRDYPFLPAQRPKKNVEKQPENFGAIRLLEDTDGDGRMDKSVVFADRLRWPQSVACYRDGVLVLSPPHLLYLKDTTGDGVADVREEWFTGFGTDNVQGLANGLEWSLDHGVYFAGGRAGAEISKGTQKLFTVGRRDIRLDPVTQTLTPVSGGEQFGHTFDDWGNRFVCNNSNHLEQVLLPLRYLDRNPQLSAATVRTIAKEGAAAPVYRTSPPEPWRLVRTARRAADPKFRSSASPTELVATGFFTSATGITVYRGGTYPPDYQGNVFIGDVGGNLVHRKRLIPNGVAQLGERTEEKVEFLTSTDNWFRPANFVNAPDGTLYILDMYWETIEHPASIPEDIKEHLDLESGNDRGRVYRLVSPGMKRPQPPKLGKATTAELVAHLRSPHGWVRDTAHRLLWEHQDTAAVPALRELVRTSDTLPQARIHALWSLHGLKSLAEDDVLVGLRDAHPRVREHAIALAEAFQAQPEAVLDALAKLTGDEDARVRWQLALSLGEFSGPKTIAALRALAPAADKDADLRIALLTAIPKFGSEFALALLADPATVGSSLAVELVRTLGGGDPKAAADVLTTILMKSPASGSQSVLLPALAEGAARAGRSLPDIATAAGSETLAVWAAKLDQLRQSVGNTQSGLTDRVGAARLLGYIGVTPAVESLGPLLTPQSPPALVQQAVRSLVRYDAPTAAAAVLQGWRSLGPAAKKDAIDGLTQTRSGAVALLGAIEAGAVKAGELDRDKQQFLSNYPQPEVREQARKLFAGGSANRKEIVAQYQSALALDGDAQRGHMVFAKICAQCHRAGTEGHLVGPDLVSVQNKSPEDLLIAILDPNREAQANFLTYTAATEQGQVFTGLMAAETAASITLRRAEAREDVVLRNQIEELVSLGVSLMPEGMEKDVQPQQMADIIAFVKSLKAPTGGQ